MQTEPGQWRSGACGAVAQWRSGAVAQWRSGAVAQWRSGAVAQWRSGAVAQWRSGAVAAVAQWRSGVGISIETPGSNLYCRALNHGKTRSLYVEVVHSVVRINT